MNSTGAPSQTTKATRTPSEGLLGSIRISWPLSASARSSTSKATCALVFTKSAMGNRSRIASNGCRTDCVRGQCNTACSPSGKSHLSARPLSGFPRGGTSSCLAMVRTTTEISGRARRTGIHVRRKYARSAALMVRLF